MTRVTALNMFVSLAAAANFLGAYKYQSPICFTVARILIGLFSGFATGVCPMYIMEISSRNDRGKIGVLNQLLITIGILGPCCQLDLFSPQRFTAHKNYRQTSRPCSTGRVFYTLSNTEQSGTSYCFALPHGKGRSLGLVFIPHCSSCNFLASYLHNDR